MGLDASFEPHPDLEDLRFLLGTWRGEGAGGYPTIGSFRYGEEMIFEDVGDRLGLTELGEGRVSGTSMDISSDRVSRTTTGDAVTALMRRYRVEDGVLTYEIDMAMDETPMSRHLAAALRKVEV